MQEAIQDIAKIQGTSARTINLCIGGGALLLGPGLVLIGLFFGGKGWEMAKSISAYYEFSDITRNLFVGVLCAMGLLMSAYRGWSKDNRCDRTIAVASWVSAWGIALVPFNSRQYSWLHFSSAGVLFGLMAAMLWWRFTEATGDADEANHCRWKRLRNRIYRGCALAILVAIIIKAASEISYFGIDTTQPANLTFWIEVLGLTAFSLGWLTKSRFILGYQKADGWLHRTEKREAHWGVEAA
ncbi:hypothetical protein GTP46_04175 [Duganella sp. FT135W]|uniref:DUF998 domain-containing protein n=1 Tax=Duganella flavida TaxID=2692175 RepID=A0A6L8K6N3_9BURK|nr:hypothetical protein [Duganella flavida]MYM21848.1 hypothetical protein [Duganella flavida]